MLLILILKVILYGILFVILSLIALFLLQIWRHSRYFKERGVLYLPWVSFQQLMFFAGRETMISMDHSFYKETKKNGKKFSGLSDSFTSPAYYVTDLDLMRTICVKDFEHFVDRRKMAIPGGEEEVMSKMLVFLESDHWKGVRAKLSPTFTSGKIRKMFSIFDKSSKRMCDYLLEATSGRGDYDLCDAYSKFAMDVIASCAFGVDSKSFDCGIGIPSEFEKKGQQLQMKLTISMVIKFVLVSTTPKLAKLLGIDLLEVGPQHYFQKVIKTVMQQRRDAGRKENDFLQLMMDAKEGLLKAEENSKETMEVLTGGADGESSFEGGSSGKLKFDDNDIVANCLLFFLGGFDTILSLLIFAAYQLAREQDVQQRLYEEVKEHIEKNNGELTYDSLLEMNYLDMFINETLRYFPPATRLERRCTKDYRMPGTDVIVKKDQLVALGVYGVHHDPDIYENPEKFDPERFLPERKNKRHPYAFAPFGHGPRNCIGMRFALTEAKAVVAHLVHRFKLEPCSKTDIPMQFANTTVLKPANGMWLNFSARGDN